VLFRSNDFVNRVAKKFIENKLDSFPEIVAIFRLQNKMKMVKEYQQILKLMTIIIKLHKLIHQVNH
jgi:hypothetical protein